MSKKVELQINSQSSLDLAILALKTEWAKHKFVTITLQKGRKRTNQQNRALHKWFTDVATAFNNAGYTVQTTLSEKVEQPWTPLLVKEIMWRKVQDASLGKRSTARLTTKELVEVFEALNLFFGERFGLHIPFPSLDYEQD